ncbi:tetraacyldisaccharide 4'-kinase [Aphanomyces astaci]|uniref:tetraacyldisaccharide 4'-kinase n=1 Tax=Aphanomyces astaci TaxID=112090 RepID=W4GNA5_APHAT|nr:tetraacyldisaccharide 4'-kinase [Aphanomyces astaci]ETV80499.1 tetraacyldisaccharide 4'-kinase [Aphanomyces astaci]|eukprot:XP_009830423.1 tetraacyldisaccharide 4'-kinase [Aphanomyces astaci]
MLEKAAKMKHRIWRAVERQLAMEPAKRHPMIQSTLKAATWVYAHVSSQKRLRQLARRRTLPVPTISFGNVTWGGTGKTPCLHHVARMINSNGHTLLLVSRGYGDDEWKMFAAEFPHSLLAIGKHRYWNAMAQLTSLSSPGRFEVYMRNAVNHQSMESRTPDEATNTNDMSDSSHPHVVALLDDGLQQWGLKKDLEIVMVDCYNPFGNGHLIPSGRLRELPEVALPAADIVVLHHASHLEGPALMQLESAIQSMARPDTIVAHSRMRLTSLPLAKQLHQHLHSRHQLKLTLPSNAPSNELVVGLCGIGCPQSFRDTLRQAFPHRNVQMHAFPDHHAYTAADLTPIVDAVRNSGRPVVVVTTEKDYFRAKDLLDDHLPSLRVALCELEFIRGGELIKQRVDRLLKDD